MAGGKCLLVAMSSVTLRYTPSLAQHLEGLLCGAKELPVSVLVRVAAALEQGANRMKRGGGEAAGGEASGPPFSAIAAELGACVVELKLEPAAFRAARFIEEAQLLEGRRAVAEEQAATAQAAKRNRELEEQVRQMELQLKRQQTQLPAPDLSLR